MVCNQCKKEFTRKNSGYKFCSQKCWHDSKLGKTYINYHGYRLIHIPTHPLANHRGNLYEHRYIMMEKLGRLLKPNELVHHRNGVKSDNRIENLEIILHLPKNGSHKGEINCPHCEKTFSIR